MIRRGLRADWFSEKSRNQNEKIKKRQLIINGDISPKARKPITAKRISQLN